MAREVTLVDAGLGNIASVERALIQVGAGVRVTGDPDEVARARMIVFPGQSAFGAVTQAIVDGAMGAALKMAIGRGDPFLGICLGMQLLFDGSDENGGQEGLHVLPGRCRRFPDDMVIEAEPGAAQAEAIPAAPSAVVENAQSEAPTSPAPASVGAMAASPPSSGGWGNDDSGAMVATMPQSSEAPVAQPTQLGMPVEQAEVAEPTTSPVPEPDSEPEVASEPLTRRLKVPHMGWNEVDPTKEHYYFVHSYYVEPGRSDDVMWMTTYGGIRFPAAVRHGNVLGCQFHPEKSQRAGLKFLRAFLLGGWG